MNLKFGAVEETYKAVRGYKNKSEINKLFKNKQMSLIAGRNQGAAFQLLLYSEEEFSLSVSDSTYFDKRGLIPAIRIKVQMENGSSITSKMNIVGFVEDDDRLLKADILLNQESVYVERMCLQPVWIELGITEKELACIHKGTVAIYCHTGFESERKIGEVSLCIDIKNVTLPKPDKYRFYLDLWQHNSNIARKHEVHLWSDEHFRVMENYVKSLADIGQKAVTAVVSEIPWSGQRCFMHTNYLSDLYEYSMISVVKDKHGIFSYDYSVMQRYIDLCFKYGIDKEIEVFGLANIWVSEEDGYANVVEDYPDDIRIRYLDQNDGCFKYMRRASEIKDYIKALEEYFICRGMIEKVRVVADEPVDMEIYRERLNVLQKTAPSFKYKTAIDHAEFILKFKDRVQDFVPKLSCVCEEWGVLEQMQRSIEGRLLWYVCCNPLLPNTFIRSPLVESILIGILTAFIGFDGFLRWNYSVWPESPREMISYRYPDWKAGDTNFVYPDNDGKPLLSLRYKCLKRGIEDFELVIMLKDKHKHPQEVLAKVWDKVLKTRDIKEFHYTLNRKAEELYSLDYNDYQAVRTFLLDELSR